MNYSLYRQLADPSVIHGHLDRLELDDSEREVIFELIDHIFHHKLLAIVLAELPSEEKIIFVQLVDNGSSIAAVDYIKKKVLNIEDKIKLLVDEVHNEVIEDINNLLEEEK